MMFFNKEINVNSVFNTELTEEEVIKQIKEIGEWSNPPEPVSYSDEIAIYSYLYAYNQGLRDYDLTGFVSIITALMTDMGSSFGMMRKEDEEIENLAMDFLNTLGIADAEMDDDKKAIAVIHFVLTLYNQSKKVELVKKTVMLPIYQVSMINEKIEGSNFSDKIRNLINDYIQNLGEKNE